MIHFKSSLQFLLLQSWQANRFLLRLLRSENQFMESSIWNIVNKPLHKLFCFFSPSQWPVPHKWYILYRAVAAAVLVCWVAGDMVYETRNFYSGDTWLWFIFATNWSFLFLALTAVVLAITCVLYQYKTYWVIGRYICFFLYVPGLHGAR